MPHYYATASREPLEVIRVNECEAASGLAASRSQALWNEIERLRVENARLDELHAHRESTWGDAAPEVARLQETVRALKPNAERYHWLKLTAPADLCVLAWRYPSATGQSTPDAAIDAARGA